MSQMREMEAQELRRLTKISPLDRAQPPLVGTQVRTLSLRPASQRPHLAGAYKTLLTLQQPRSTFASPDEGFFIAHAHMLPFLSRKYAQRPRAVRVKGVIYELSCSS